MTKARDNADNILINFVQGLTLSNNSSDPNNKIDIAPGRARGNGVTVDNPTTRTAALGAVTPNTTYHIHALRNNTTGEFSVTADVSPTSPYVAPGWTRVQRLGAILTDGSGNIRPFVQSGNKFFFNATAPIYDYSGTGNRAKAPLTCTLPNGIRVEGLFSVLVVASDGNTDVNMAIYDGENPNIRVTVQNHVSTGENSMTVPVSMFTNSSRQIQLEVAGSASGSNASLIRTMGWVDYQIPRIG